MCIKISVFLFLFSAFAVAAGPELADRIKVTEIIGLSEIKVLRASTKKTEKARVGGMLFVGDEVISVKGQVVSLEAYDGSVWKLGPNSRLKIQARNAEAKSFFSWTFLIQKGSMWGRVEKQAAGEGGFRLKVRTKTAALGVRGTEYLIAGNESSSEIDVLEGHVWWGSSLDFQAGSYREVRAGQHAEIDQTGRIRIRESEGDKLFLATKYGLVQPDRGAKGDGPRKN